MTGKICLASNPHNSQPWLFRMTDTEIDLFADPSWQIGIIDPFRREMYIGLGCDQRRHAQPGFRQLLRSRQKPIDAPAYICYNTRNRLRNRFRNRLQQK